MKFPRLPKVAAAPCLRLISKRLEPSPTAKVLPIGAFQSSTGLL